jgi:hypothetical protein
MSTHANPHDHDRNAREPSSASDEVVEAPQRFALWHATVYVMPWPFTGEERAVYVHHHTHHAPGEHDVGHAHSDTVEALEDVAHEHERVDVLDTPAWPHAPLDGRDEAVEAERERQEEAYAEALAEVTP